MTDDKIPIRGQSATFSVNGAKQGDAVLLLYPNELTAVRTRSIGNWVYVGVPAIYLGVHYLFSTRSDSGPSPSGTSPGGGPGKPWPGSWRLGRWRQAGTA